MSELTDRLWEDYEAFAKRDLSSFAVEYLFVDAIYESLRLQGGPAEALLCAWAILADGRKVQLHLTLGNKESYDAWLAMLRDMVRRGLRTPVSVTSDGAVGLVRVIEDIWPKSLRLRCWVHKMRNVLDKVPEYARAEVKAHLVSVRDAPTYDAAQQALQATLTRFDREFPAAMASLADDPDATLAHLRLPAAHRKHVRTTDENVKTPCYPGRQSRRKMGADAGDPRAKERRLGMQTPPRRLTHWRRIVASQLGHSHPCVRGAAANGPSTADRPAQLEDQAHALAGAFP